MAVRRIPRFLAGLVALFLAVPAVADMLGQIRVGEPFPDLVLPALEDGRPRAVSQFRGEKVVLHVFASW